MQILRSLTYTSLFFLNSFTVAENINVFSSPPLSIASEPYSLNLSCAECAFSYSECLENVQPAFLVRLPSAFSCYFSLLSFYFILSHFIFLGSRLTWKDHHLLDGERHAPRQQRRHLSHLMADALPCTSTAGIPH
jgi:hypothetical protein